MISLGTISGNRITNFKVISKQLVEIQDLQITNASEKALLRKFSLKNSAVCEHKRLPTGYFTYFYWNGQLVWTPALGLYL